MKGKLIIFEGIDGSGKTTTIKRTMKILKDKNIVYVKGFTNDTRFSKFIHSNPDSSLFYFYFILKTSFVIKPLLAKGKIILLDRYKQSVDIFPPDSTLVRNKIVKFLSIPFFIKPDLYIHLKVSVKECIKRLIKKKDEEHKKYHMTLIKKPETLKLMLKEHDKVYNNIKGNKIAIDTTNKNIKQCSKIITGAIKNVS